MRVTKDMLSNKTRKKLLYLDQSFLSVAARARRHAWVDEALESITKLLDLQLLAVPYSSTHIAEADLFKERDALVNDGEHLGPSANSVQTRVDRI